MATTIKISALPTASGIDGSADFLPIVQSSVTNKINRNTLLGLSSAPVGINDSQTLTNKTISTTNVITQLDGSFTLENTSDATKKAVFSLSGITTGNTRTLTIPDASATLVGTATTQTLTNKTLTSPTITGGTIDNTTITVDSISGHTTPTIVTVGGVQMNNGVVSTSGAVTSTSIAVGAVQPQALTSGTGTGWVWSSWTPSWSNLTTGNGTTSAAYIQIGKTVIFHLSFTFGSGSSMSTSPTFSLPVTANSIYDFSTGEKVITCDIENTGVASYGGSGYLASNTTCTLLVINCASTYQVFSTITSTVPFTWGTGSKLFVSGYYQAA